jgi:Ni/Co efflux regulator RcnB
MIKTMFAISALALVAAAPAAAQTAAPLPMCSATVHDSCNQGADNPRAMTAEQAMASGGVGDRKTDKADYMAPAMPGKPMMHKHKMMHHKMMKKTTTETTTTTEPKPM